MPSEMDAGARGFSRADAGTRGLSRADDDPKRFTRVTLHFALEGGAPRDAVERAIALSREKFSVTAVEETRPPTIPVRPRPRSGPSRRIPAYPMKLMPEIRIT